MLGLALLAGELALWRLVFDEAGFFAPIMALTGGVSLALAAFLSRRGRNLLGRAIRITGYGATLLAIAAALSLGAFLPPMLAEWLSPVLGRFGGALALGIVAVGAAIAALRGPERWRRTALDLATITGIGAPWLWTQTARQINFLPPPTTAATLMPRLQLLFGLALVLGIGAIVLSVPQRQHRAERWQQLGAWCRRWCYVAALLGLGVGLVVQSDLAPWFALPLALSLGATLLNWRQARLRPRVVTIGRGVGWLFLTLLTLTLLYAATSEDLEIVFLRNTGERRAAIFWRDRFGAGPSTMRPAGTITGVVRDQAGQPLAGASVVLADRIGQTFTARSAPDGHYTLTGVPAGSYLPLAISPDHVLGGRSGFAGRVATVHEGRATERVDFRLAPRPGYDQSTNDSLQLEPQTEIMIEGLTSGTTLRRPFTFANRGKVLDGGLIHEPPAALGPGPFPILLIIYPGEAASWEGVSAPLAERGFVVVSYFPRRLLDLDGDLDDLRLLLNLTAAGKLSTRGDGRRIAIAGGSVSTVYTYLLAQAVASAPPDAHLRAAILYGGLFDLYAFRHSWEDGQVIIDPGISALEYLLVAFGRPDTRPEIYLRLSPHYTLGATSLPPTLLVHAEQDIIVPPGQSRLAAAELTRLGINHRLLIYPELEHYLDISKRDPAQLDMLEQTIAFLHQWTGAK
jgi:hypothetical protein